jgi:hypothetical protein
MVDDIILPVCLEKPRPEVNPYKEEDQESNVLGVGPESTVPITVKGMCKKENYNFNE